MYGITHEGWRLPKRKLGNLAHRICREFMLQSPTRQEFADLYCYRYNMALPAVTRNLSGQLWVDSLYIAYQLDGQPLRYVYIAKRHINEELYAFKVIEKPLPKDIKRAFDTAMAYMRNRGCDIWIAEKYRGCLGAESDTARYSKNAEDNSAERGTAPTVDGHSDRHYSTADSCARWLGGQTESSDSGLQNDRSQQGDYRVRK